MCSASTSTQVFCCLWVRSLSISRAPATAAAAFHEFLSLGQRRLEASANRKPPHLDHLAQSQTTDDPGALPPMPEAIEAPQNWPVQASLSSRMIRASLL